MHFVCSASKFAWGDDDTGEEEEEVAFPAVVASHFSPAAARPRALATVDVAGAAYGTTSTLDRWLASLVDFPPADPLVLARIVGVLAPRTRRACWVVGVEAMASLTSMPRVLSVRFREEGTGRVLDERRTLYWRSQRRSASSGVVVVVMPARRTWEDPRERMEIS